MFPFQDSMNAQLNVSKEHSFFPIWSLAKPAPALASLAQTSAPTAQHATKNTGITICVWRNALKISMWMPVSNANTAGTTTNIVNCPLSLTPWRPTQETTSFIQK